SPNADACATSASATIAPVSVVRNIPARLNDSFQASAREASRLQCSVDRIWSRMAGVTTSAWRASAGPAFGPGSAPMAVPAALRPGDRSATDPTHAGLDEMDRRKVRPRNAEVGLRLAVVASKIFHRRGRDDPPRARQVRTGHDGRAQISGRVEVRGRYAAEIG